MLYKIKIKNSCLTNILCYKKWKFKIVGDKKKLHKKCAHEKELKT